MTTEIQFELVEIYDRDNGHEIGGQDLPLLVTLRYAGTYEAAEAMIDAHEGLSAFNIQASRRHPAPNHIEFLTFEEREIYRFTGIPRPLYEDEEVANRYWRSVYVRNVGELRAAMADLPDDFPLIHTGPADGTERDSRQGVHIYINEWQWQLANRQQHDYRRPAYAMRIDPLDGQTWERVVNGAFVNQTRLYD